jgi:hypothetical protein
MKPRLNTQQESVLSDLSSLPFAVRGIICIIFLLKYHPRRARRSWEFVPATKEVHLIE